MVPVSRARWVVWSTALLLTVATGLVIVDSVLDMSRAKDAVATTVTARFELAVGAIAKLLPYSAGLVGCAKVIVWLACVIVNVAVL